MQKTKKPQYKKITKNTLSASQIFLSCLKWLVILGLSGTVAIVAVAAVGYATAYPKIPDVHRLAEYEPKLPLRIYTADAVLIGEYSEERRDFVSIEQIPQMLRDAVLAVEDANFYHHVGVDYKGLLRATLAQFTSPGGQGASTITMQVARNFYLSNEKTYSRKIYEILTALRIESILSKDQILEIYMNQIFLGQRSYGFAAAAHIYFGKKMDELTIGEIAMLAGLPQLPSANNPITNPKNARTRQLHVLNRMKTVGAITHEQYDQAVAEPLLLRRPTAPELHAEYAADEAQEIIRLQFKSDAYTNGLNVYTTLQSAHQKPAYHALRKGLTAYEKKQFYRGPEGKITLPPTPEELQKAVAAALLEYPDKEELMSAVVISVELKKVVVTRDGTQHITITGQGLKPVESGLAANASVKIKIEPGSIVRITRLGEDSWDITQTPQVEGSVVSLDPQTGAIIAMVGGFDFAEKKFNHSTQAWRQPGSSFKSFVYSAALERGITPHTILNDAPIIVRNPGNNKPWTPKNFGSSFAGRGPMYEAFARSRNIPAILTIDAISPAYAQQWIQRFSFAPDKNPANLTLVLGAGSATPLQMACAYAVFANGGYRVDPYLISRITDSKGHVLYEYSPPELNEERRVIPARNAFVMNTLLSNSGSNARRMVGRTDIYGKTGTTNDSNDTWFIGYSPTLVASVWVGYDQPKSLGNRETGYSLALPIWSEYMKIVLKGVPEQSLRPVSGVSNVRGQWVYDEFAGSGGVRSLGDNLSPNPEDIPVVDQGTQGTILDMFR